MKKSKKKAATKKAAAKKPAKKVIAKKKPAKPTKVSKPTVRSSTKTGANGVVTWNFKLLSHHLLDGFGGMGEGMSISIAKDGRRIMWLAHESAPKNFTAVDVSDPRKPKVVCQTDLPHNDVRSNSLETCGHIMAVAYQTKRKNMQPAGMELFDISVPENPKSIGYFDCSGEHSRGVHQLWFCDGEYVHMASSAPDFVPTNPLDDQFYRIIDVRNPSKPTEVGRWHMPGTKQGDNAPPPPRHSLDKGYRAHNCNVYPQRPDRCYLAYIDGGMHVLDISDKSNPKRISSWTNSPPYTGFMHTVVPLFDRGLMLVTDESTENNARRARRDQPRADLDLPAAGPQGLFGPRPVRRTQHPRERAAADLLAERPDRARHFLQRRSARLRHFQPVSAAGGRHLRAAGSSGRADRNDPDQ
jgi:hypothetical protein